MTDELVAVAGVPSCGARRVCAGNTADCSDRSCTPSAYAPPLPARLFGCGGCQGACAARAKQWGPGTWDRVWSLLRPLGDGGPGEDECGGGTGGVAVLLAAWRVFIAADTPQLSTFTARSAPPELLGSGVATTTRIGIALTIVSVMVAEQFATVPMALVALCPCTSIGFLRLGRTETAT
jgi:hypothetical protein